MHRLIVQFRKAFKRNDKAVCLSSTMFIAHLVNQQVVHEMLAAQILLLLLNKPTDDSVEIAVGLMREVGQHLEEMSGPIALAVFDQFRSILHEADIDTRTQYMIEVLFQVRKDRYKDNPAIREELDLVEEEDQITHRPSLDDEVDVQDGLNVFKYDEQWQEHEDAYRQLKAEILGEAEGSDENDEYESDESSEGEEEKQERQLEIKDQSNTDLINLRRTIYLTIKSSGGFEECCHKLMRINLPPGREEELVSMLIECASQERTYDKFYGLIGERFCKLNFLWRDLFEAAFARYYETIHRYETNRLRIIAQFFGHLLASDATGWHVLSVIRLNEEDTTSSSRIFIKILFEDLAQALSMKKLAERMRDEALQPSFDGVFPKDNPRNTRFAINFFTAVGMGSLTEDMREFLKNMPKPAPPALPPAAPDTESDSDSVSSYSSYSSRSRSPPRRRDRRNGHSESRSQSRSRTPPRRAARRESHSSASRSPSPAPRRRRRGPSAARSVSPPPRRRRYSSSVSVSPAPKRRGAARDRSHSRAPSGSPRRDGQRNGLSPSRSRSRSRSPPPPRRAAAVRERSPPRRDVGRGRDGRSRSSSSSRSPSRSPPRRRLARDVSSSRSRSRSPPVRRGGGRGRGVGRSVTPPPRRRKNTSSASASPVRGGGRDGGEKGGRGGGRARASDFL